MAASDRQGMGAVPFADGVTFRVWAPFASAVAVAGTFTGWEARPVALTQEAYGYWSTHVPAAKLGDEYKFIIMSQFAPQPLWRNDPYARSMTNSAGNSIIAHTDFPWQSAGYSTPPWNEL